MTYTDCTPWSVIQEENLRFSESRRERQLAASELTRILRLEINFKYQEAIK